MPMGTGSLKVPLVWALLEFAINSTIEPTDPRAWSPQAKLLTGKEHNPTYQQIIGFKALLSRALSIRARPNFSHCQSLSSRGLHKPLNLIHQRADKRSKKNNNPTAARTKTHYRKLITMKKQKVVSQMKGQDKTPEKQLNEVEVANLPENEFKIMTVMMIQDLGKTTEKMRKYLPKTYKN